MEDGERGKRVQEIYHFWNSCVANRCMSLNWQPVLVFAHSVKAFVSSGFVAAGCAAAELRFVFVAKAAAKDPESDACVGLRTRLRMILSPRLRAPPLVEPFLPMTYSFPGAVIFDTCTPSLLLGVSNKARPDILQLVTSCGKENTHQFR